MALLLFGIEPGTGTLDTEFLVKGMGFPRKIVDMARIGRCPPCNRYDGNLNMPSAPGPPYSWPPARTPIAAIDAGASLSAEGVVDSVGDRDPTLPVACPTCGWGHVIPLHADDDKLTF